MGIEIVRLGQVGHQKVSTELVREYTRPIFGDYSASSPFLCMWMMTAPDDKPFLPWWTYSADIDGDLRQLNELWSVSNRESLFDLLFLSFLKKNAGPNLFFVFPGNIKSENWSQVTTSDQSTYDSGQGCVYHLKAYFQQRPRVNWVPYWQPQSVVKDPPFSHAWRLFGNSNTDDASKSISFFSLSDTRLLPQVIKCMIDKNDQRSIKLSEVVDYFGVYSSPLKPDYRHGAILYTKKDEILKKWRNAQENFLSIFDETQSELLKKAHPTTVNRLLSRHVTL